MTPDRDPPIPPSSPRRVSLLPRELDDIDAAWGDEPATVVPSRAPSLPPRAPIITLADLDDADDRVTTIPELPRDEFAKRVMAENKSEPARPDRPSQRPGSSSDDFEFVLDQDNPFDRPTRDGALTAPALTPRPSKYPTAPPPTGEDERMRTVPRVPRPHAGEGATPGAGSRAVTLTPAGAARSELPPATHREPLSTVNGNGEPMRPAKVDPRDVKTAPRRQDFGELGGRAAMDRETRPDRRNVPRADTDPPLSAMERARRALTPQDRPDLLVPAAAPAPDPHAEMRDRFAMGDFSGALDVAEVILARAPSDREATTVAAKCREVLYDMYSSRIAGFDREISVIMGPDQLRWLSLDHRAGFLLAMIDRGTTVDDLLDVSGMPRLDALRILCDLLDQKVLGLGA